MIVPRRGGFFRFARNEFVSRRGPRRLRGVLPAPLWLPAPHHPRGGREVPRVGGRTSADRGRRRGGDRRFRPPAVPHPFQEVARVDQEGVGGRPAAVPEALTGNTHRFAHRRGGCHRSHPAPSRALARGVRVHSGSDPPGETTLDPWLDDPFPDGKSLALWKDAK